MRHWRDMRPYLRWPGAVLVMGRSATTPILATAAGAAMLVLVLVIAAIALGAAFGRSAERRRACLHALQTLLRLAPRTGRR